MYDQAAEEAIKRACKRAGWNGWTVKSQDKEYAGSVTDEIVARINQSGLVIADFTHNKRGVYYEAGYAEGRKIPVLYTVKRGHIDDPTIDSKRLHFDTRNTLHIDWNDETELEERLVSKIEAVINR